MRIIQLNLHLSLAFMCGLLFFFPLIVAALSKPTDTSPNPVLSTLSNHCRHQRRLHVPRSPGYRSELLGGKESEPKPKHIHWHTLHSLRRG